MHIRATRGALALALIATVVIASQGCNMPPKGDSSGRVPAGTTTRGEAGSGLMRTDDLISASDRIATALAQDIDSMTARDFANRRVTVTFGDIVNKTSKMPTTDFEYLRDRIKSRLMESQHVRNNVRFIESRARRDELHQRELEGEPGLTGTSQPSVDRDFFCFLNGNMYSVDRPETRLYYLKFELMRASDGETVFSKDYEVKYVAPGG